MPKRAGGAVLTCPATTDRVHALHQGYAVRDEPLTSNLIVVRNSGRRTPCKKQYDAPGCTGIYSFPIDRSPDARDS